MSRHSWASWDTWGGHASVLSEAELSGLRSRYPWVMAYATRDTGWVEVFDGIRSHTRSALVHRVHLPH